MGKNSKAGFGSPAEGGRKPNGAGEPEPARKKKRFWAQHKVEAVLRLLRGEDLELLSRELGVPASDLSEWQEVFLAHGAEGFKKRSGKDDLENRRLKEMLGEKTMTIELLEEKLKRVQSPRPLARRRSRR